MIGAHFARPFGKGRQNAPAEATVSPRAAAHRPSQTPQAQATDRAADVPYAQGRSRLDRAWRRVYAAVLKTVFRATHSAEQRHSERLWPHARVIRDDAGRVTRFVVHGRDFPLANADASIRQGAGAAGAQGETNVPGQPTLPPLHLIACGPSVAQIDYPALTAATPTHKRIGVNGAVALTRQYGMQFDYYCITDNGFIRHREDLVAHLIAQDLVLFTTPICLWTILQRFPQSAFRCRVFLMERVGQQALRPKECYADVVARSNGTMAHFDTAMPLGFSHDIARGVFPGGTVAFEALQVAAWLGHGDVYLHGLDLGNAAEKPRFYESPEDKLPTMIHRQLEGEILPSFQHAAPILRAKRVRVTNLSMESALDRSVFPKVDWRMLPCMLAYATIARAHRRTEPERKPDAAESEQSAQSARGSSPSRRGDWHHHSAAA
ncbi:hypothetical protein [Robbsia sp. KACC 23696]|uniref:hypothetical protein n=1 Tax=Robbsia sp. KACC 23696 TaxID=3149231 RepID=UPI00325B775C